jgi:hypothetical protein
MRTTVRLDDALFEQAKREARRRNETLTSLIEQGLRLILADPEVSLPVCTRDGGTLPGVDLNDTSSTLDAMEGRGRL